MENIKYLQQPNKDSVMAIVKSIRLQTKWIV